MKEPVITLQNITKMYGEFTAVDRLSLNIYRGEIFGLLGPNGAGKSTTILMMLGLTEPTEGTVHVCGVDSTRYPIEVKKKVGYLPDDVGFYEDMTGMENLLYTAQLNGMSRKEAVTKAHELLEHVGLFHAKDKKAGTYSRGMRQRLGLADVLIKNPEIIILDEPTLGIDPEGVRELLALIERLSREMGITVLLSSHHLHQVQQICDRVGLFVKGQLIAVGDIDTLSENLFKDEPISIHVQVENGPATLVETLAQLEGVEKVEKTAEDNNMFHLICNQDLTSQIAHTVVQSGAHLLHLSKKEYGLDEIYLRYFEGGDAGEQAVG